MISEMVRDQIEARGVHNAAVLHAMRQVPRHEFVPEEYASEAYADHPLPIGYGQTISQPYIVALMTEALSLRAGDRVLEVGTGSGYQTAIISALGAEVYTVENILELHDQAKNIFLKLGTARVHMLLGDGSLGWPEHAPYQAVIVTAAPEYLPFALGEQLAEGGRMVIPLGQAAYTQTLWLYHKYHGKLQQQSLGAVRFVPLTGTQRKS